MEIVKIMMVVAQIVKLKIYGHVINKFHNKTDSLFYIKENLLKVKNISRRS